MPTESHVNLIHPQNISKMVKAVVWTPTVKPDDLYGASVDCFLFLSGLVSGVLRCNLLHFLSQGVPGKTTPVHWSAASSSSGSSKLNCSLCMCVCINVWMSVYCMYIGLCHFSNQLFILCNKVKIKRCSFLLPPAPQMILDVTWFDCGASCRVLSAQWCVVIYVCDNIHCKLFKSHL